MKDELASFWELPHPVSFQELMKRVRRLALVSQKNATGFAAGDYRTKVQGQGLEFQEARKYVYGESIRQIDWNMTARMNEPYVRVFHEEREREIFIALDVSPSMHAGWQQRRKIEYAVEIAASIAHSAIAARDRLGFVTYSNIVHQFSPPKRGQAQFFNTVKTLYQSAIDKPQPCTVSDMRQAVFCMQRLRGKRFMIFFLSDFIDYDIPVDLRYLQARHEVFLLHVYDPLEYQRDTGLSFYGASPEGKRNVGIVHPGITGSLAGMQSFLSKTAGSYHIRFQSLSTTQPVKPALNQLYSMMRKV